MGGWLKGRNALLTGLLLASYPALTAAALWPLPWAFAALVPLSYAAEIALPKRAADALGRAHLGTTLRFMTREAAAVLLLARTPGIRTRWFVLLAGGLFLFQGARAVQSGLANQLHRCHELMPITTRNLDLPSLRIPPPPPKALVRWRGLRLLYLDALPVGLAAFGTLVWSFGQSVGQSVGGPSGEYGTAAGLPGVAGAGAALLIEAAAVAALVVCLRRAWHLRDRGRIVAAVEDRVRAYRPEVLLYFSGPRSATYQVTMWLGTLERIGLRVLVVLRERAMVAALGPTTLPVVCVPSSVDLMNFRGFDSARVALFPANTGNNIHMLRVPGVRSVFIGHGDSDKEASFNPFTRVYDEVWVAGPAGRDRYRRADVGVRDEDIAEVGRPQLAGIASTSPYAEGAVPYRTVLYAPTWEGWSDDLFHTSIVTMGPALVRALLGQGVRVIYKPHPLTGHRSPAARAAHRKIMAMLRAAESSAGSSAVPHVAVTKSELALYDCFNEADLLISDISSVVSDFLASGKPYVVTNVAGLPDAEFRTRYPSTEAAYLLTGDLDELDGILRLLGDGDDVMAEDRRRLRAHLLGGPDHRDSLARFEEAIKTACARAARREPVHA
ncbi:CDP-glycerol glycerophosphotransferase family protein [Sphaerimonospora thailandensis]|uniref:CDP-glycerol:poly(Glycerophosphate) glycerophosphotransferase n=1 Tax=Sphaerimonospora thailandensis TaxID=795644 RepID=A0A8J3RCN5_9ACTN|nr:CDP-glycerol glycerophosphotransferase family protein [Sphaerimonospora thailandensis]GIH72269.1 hypothetical protein Mth01_45220 [Sphaerimonospora thailandensis]